MFIFSGPILINFAMTTPNYASKSTPNKSGAISKSLLTPCRRVGLGRKAAGKSPLTPSPLGKQGVLGQRETPVQKRRVADGDKTTSESFKKLKANDQESMNESYETDSCKIKKTSKAVSEKQTGGGGQKPKQSAIDEKQETDSCRKQKANNRKQNTDCVKKGDSCSGSKANKKQKSTNCKDQVSPLPLQNHNKSCMNVTNQSTDVSIYRYLQLLATCKWGEMRHSGVICFAICPTTYRLIFIRAQFH